jgi:predicted TIM-barrel fold metal-dependent hydrolase
LPAELERDRYLRALVEAGYGKRIMFGSDESHSQN